jgi:hypothetical protein
MGRTVAAVRRHWLVAVLLAAGLVLRVLAEVGYRPALLYIDSYKYLYHADGNDPVGYRVLLKPVLAVANLDTVAAVQHLLGLAMAVAIYVLLLRRGTARWLAALAVAPVLLDAYQLQIEQTIMPDAMFEALLVAGLVVLLWRPVPALGQVALAGLLLGATAPVWQVGEVLIGPAVVYVAFTASGWRRTLSHVVVVCVAFALPIVAYESAADAVGGHFRLANGGITTFYGRVAAAADCATLRLPADERALCPSRQLVAELGIDGLEHSQRSPLRPLYLHLPSYQATRLVSAFNRQVLSQQPGRVAVAIGNDAAGLFAVHRVTSPGDTPISRWQFQDTYPQYQGYVQIQDGRILLYHENQDGRPVLITSTQDMGGGPAVIAPVARFLRGYQLDGGYTPGPLLLACVLLGLAGSVLLLRRRRNGQPGERDAARACCLIFAAGAVILLSADATEFSWRYQLPALVTLPVAAALAVTAILAWLSRRWGWPRRGWPRRR